MTDTNFDLPLDDRRAAAIANVLAHEAAPADQALVEDWLSTDPSAEQRLRLLRQAWALRPEDDRGRAEHFVARVRTAIAASSAPRATLPESMKRPVGPRTRSSRWNWPLAGVLAAGVLIAGWYSLGTDMIPAPHPEARGEKRQDYVTSAGQRAEFRLDDGTVVVLGPVSRLTLASDFGTSTRDVVLDGQALFTVTHHGDVPFVVRAGDAQTRVLGTSFTVRKYADDSTVRVLVAQGKVSLNTTVLSNGDLGVATGIAPATVTHDINTASELAWTEGKLVLNNVPLRDAKRELERWYGVTIAIADPHLLDQPVITTLNTEGSREALSLIATALNASVTFNGTRATFFAH